MEQKFGISNTKELLNFGFAMQKAFADSAADGIVNWEDTMNFLDPIRKAIKAFNNIQEVRKEILDLDEQEVDELYAFVRESFDLPNEQLEILIERTIDYVLSGYTLGVEWNQFRKAA